jgi:hypothetical protein
VYNLILTLSDEQRQRAEIKARELGYATPDEYLYEVVVDALDDTELPDVDDGRSQAEILEGLKSSLRQALRGEGRPIEHLLNELENGS